jgi:GGDEF domain-containing protein
MFGLFVELIGIQIPFWFAGGLYIVICSVYLTLLWRSQKECERLAQVVYTDSTTGFMNCTALEEDLRTTKGPVAVILVSLDLDNQTGYQYTEMLHKTAQALEIAVGAYDIYRHSDNEFVVLLMGKYASLSTAQNAAERIKHCASYFAINVITGVSIAWKDGLFAIDRAKQEICLTKHTNKSKRPVLCYSHKTPASNNA